MVQVIITSLAIISVLSLVINFWLYRVVSTIYGPYTKAITILQHLDKYLTDEEFAELNGKIADRIRDKNGN